MRDIAAAPRPTGGAAIAAARGRCAAELRGLGFDVREVPFEFSAFPGRFATPLIGAAAAAVVGIAGQLGVLGARYAPLVAVLVGGIALYLASAWLAKRGVLMVPALRERGVNLEATRPGVAPTLWLCAHLDSKSQPVPTLLRSTGIVLEGTGYILTLAVSIAVATGGGAIVHEFFWASAALVTLVGAVPVVLSMVGQRSPGALDNASGVAMMIAAARQLQDLPEVGVLITDAEELGLAGARAWVRGQAKATVLNSDGVDDDGDVHVMFTHPRPRALLDAVERASRTSGVRYHATRLIPGILTDSVAFADAGMATITFSRGTWASLARVHSPSDDLAHLRGTGIADVATLVARTARESGEPR